MEIQHVLPLSRIFTHVGNGQLDRSARQIPREERVIWTSVAKFFSALRALGFQKQNFFPAARARCQRKRVTRSDLT